MKMIFQLDGKNLFANIFKGWYLPSLKNLSSYFLKYLLDFLF